MIKAVNNIQFTSNVAQTPVNSAGGHLAASKPDEFVKEGDENKKKMSKGKIAAIIGGVVALGALGIYLLTRGKGKIKSENLKNTTENIVGNVENLDKISINTDLLKDENLSEVLKGLNHSFNSDCNGINIFLREIRRKLYKQYLTVLSKCKSAEEFDSTLDRIKNTPNNVDTNALGCVKNSNADLDIVISQQNKHNTFSKQINLESNVTPQEKMNLLLQEYINLAKTDLQKTISTYHHGYVDFNGIMKTITKYLEMLS